MQIHKPTQSLLMQVDDPLSLRTLLPKSKLLTSNDFNIALKHDNATTKILRNLGYEVPSPIECYYDWPGKFIPFEHQKQMAEFMCTHKRGFNLSEMGTMKTAATLWAADYLMNQKKVNKALILSPLSTLQTVWAGDIFNTLMHRKCIALHGSAAQRIENLEKDVDFYILNHHGIKIKELNKALEKRLDINLLIVDEGSKFKNAGTDLYEYLAKYIRDDLYIWWLTGTPCAHAPTDVWSQVKLINPKNVPRFFGAFKRATMVQVSPFKWVPRAEAYTIAYNAMQPAIRFAKKDCITLPPLTKTDRQAPMSKEQSIAFKSMKNDMIAEFNATQSQGKPISAINAADRLIKLRQILCGTIRDPQSGKYIPLDCVGRVNVLKECIEEANAKIIIVAPFKGIIYNLEKELEKSWSVGILNGDVSAKARDRIIQNFKAIRDPHILLCHPQVMAHGLNLTEADTTILYAPIFSCDDYLQLIERFNRAGQKNKMTIVRIGAHSLEWDIYHAIDEKNLTQATILSMYEKVVR